MSCRCCVDAAQEPMSGTAPAARRWLLVEDPGPWGAYAVADSRFPDAVKEHLAALGDEGVRVQLIRRHGPHLRHRAGERQVFSVDLDADGDARCQRATISSLAELLEPMPFAPHGGPLLLVCTNGKRDECCARRGRPVTAALAARWPELAWETTHLGGHRFAATMIVLPDGTSLGRLDPEAAVAQVDRVLQGVTPDPRFDRT